MEASTPLGGKNSHVQAPGLHPLGPISGTLFLVPDCRTCSSSMMVPAWPLHGPWPPDHCLSLNRAGLDQLVRAHAAAFSEEKTTGSATVRLELPATVASADAGQSPGTAA